VSIRRWDPFDELTSLRESMERLFDDLFTTRRPGRALAPALWEPAVELFETEGDVVFRAEMEQEQKGRNYYRRELRYGSFERAVGLPASVQADQAKATFRHGILEVRIPKAERGRAKSIKVEVE